MSLKHNTPCDTDCICPFGAEDYADCEFYCGEVEPQDDPEIWEDDEDEGWDEDEYEDEEDEDDLDDSLILLAAIIPPMILPPLIL